MGPDPFDLKFDNFARNALASGYNVDEISRFKDQARELDNRQRLADLTQLQPPQRPVPAAKKGNFLTSLIPAAGGTLGGVGGGALGGALAGTAVLPGIGTAAGALLGALGGGFAGGFGGKVLQNKVEGNKNLTQGAVKEGAINGVLSAGPLRLGKLGIDTARGIKAGAGALSATNAAADAAANMSLKRTIGKKLVDSSNDLAIKGFRFTPTQLTNFRNKYGEDASKVIKRYGLVGKSADDIERRVIQPLQGEFDSIATKLPDMSIADLQKAFASKYKPLMNSAVEDSKAIGSQLKQQADTIVDKYSGGSRPYADLQKQIEDAHNAGDNALVAKLVEQVPAADQNAMRSSLGLPSVPANNVNALRKEFDSLVTYADKAANPARYGVNKRAADALRGVMQQKADETGLTASNGLSFKDVGMELSKLRQLTANIAGREDVGRGNLPLGLIPTVAGGIGGTVGGVPGALAAGAAAGAANSPMGRKALATGVEKVGQRLMNKAAKTNPYGPVQIAKRVLPADLALGALDQSATAPRAADLGIDAAPTSSFDGTGPASSDFATPAAAMKSSQSKRFFDAATLALQSGDLKSAQTLMSFADQASKMEDAQKPPPVSLSDTAIQNITDLRSGIQQLGALHDNLTNNSPILGRVRALNPYDSSFQTQQANIDRVRQIVGKALEGGVLRKEDEEKYRRILPTMQDTPAVAQYKIDNVMGQLQQKLQEYATYQSNYGKGAGQLSIPSSPTQLTFEGAN